MKFECQNVSEPCELIFRDEIFSVEFRELSGVEGTRLDKLQLDIGESLENEKNGNVDKDSNAERIDFLNLVKNYELEYVKASIFPSPQSEADRGDLIKMVDTLPNRTRSKIYDLCVKLNEDPTDLNTDESEDAKKD